APARRTAPIPSVQTRLYRRVPGATLDPDAPATPPARPPLADRPSDPEEVRDRINQFELGVARALREISSAHRNEEGTL
ncbi:hypothetical protein ACFQ0D_32200, partial [Micromonospora zhanjiangensis]